MTKNRRFRRVLRWCGFVSILLALLIGGGAWWAHQHLTKLIVGAVNRAYPGLMLSAKTAALTSSSELEMKEVRWRVRADHSEALRVPSAKVRFSWGELRQHFVREIIIEGPRVQITDSLLAELSAEAVTGANASGAGERPWRVGRISIVDGSARVDVAAAPVIRFKFDLEVSEGASIADSAKNRLRLTSARVQLRNESADAMAIPAMTVTFSPEELRHSKIREITVDAPRFVVTDALLALAPKKAGGADESLAWEIGRVNIERGTARIDLAGAPQVEFGFSAQMRERQPAGDTPVELNLSNIIVRLRQDGSEALSIRSARVAASLEALGKQTIGEISIEDPNAVVNDTLLEAIPTATSQNGAPADAASAGWKIEKLAVKGGHARIDLRGAPLAEFGFSARTADAALGLDGADELQSLEISDLALRTRNKGVEPFLRVPAIRAEFRVPELLRSRRIARLRIEHLDFRYNANFREMIASGDKPAPAADAAVSKDSTAGAGHPITISELRLVDGRMRLDDLGLGIPPMECRIETAFREFALTGDGGAAGRELQTIELSQIEISSPFDPFFTVLKLETIFVRFTLAGLWKREIEEVAIVQPTLAIGPDLFWYIDRVQENAASAPKAAAAAEDAGPDWSIREFNAKSGQLVLALEGQQKLALPMPFESHAENLNFRRLSDLRLKLAIDMPEQDYRYPGYELALLGVRGRVEFSLPPQKRENNLVNTLHVREVRWKNFRGRDFFLGVTYDAHGIYGNLGGKGYGGLLNGQFNFLLDSASRWNGWVSGNRIDLKPVTDILAPEKFSLTGPANFRLSVTARATEFESVVGDFSATRSGQLRIGKLDDIVKTLPGDWSGLKRGLARISLETLRDFAYEAAHGDFRFNGRAGAMHLDLRGPSGARVVSVNVHDETAPKSAQRVAASKP